MRAKERFRAAGSKKTAGRHMPLVLAVMLAAAMVFACAPLSQASPGWTAPENLSPGSTSNQSPQIALDADGHPHAVWYGTDATTNRVWYSNYVSTYTVNASVSGGNGNVDPLTQQVAPGDTASINIAPDAGYQIASITDNGVPQAVADPYVITNVTADHDVVVTFACTFYFAEGTCRPGFDPYICIQNPGDAAAEVTITYMKGDGTTDTQSLAVGAHSRATVGVKGVLGEGADEAHDFSAKVECTNGQQIIAERPMYFNYNGWCTGGHDVVGATAPSNIFYFAEGTCRPGFDPYLCIQNPGGTAAEVTITYMKGDGTTDTQSLSVAPNSRSTVAVKGKLGEANDEAHDFSTKVECTNGQQIIAERPMYFNYNGVWTGGHDVVGATSPACTFYFAEGTCRPGFDPYICIQNPGDAAAEVTITYMKGDGTTDTQSLAVGAHSRATVGVKGVLGEGADEAHDFSAKVECTNGQQIIAERPMYFNYNGWCTGGHDVVGATAPSNIFYFAEGTCRPGFDPYLCIQNPGGTAAEVTITYMKGDGTTDTQSLSVAPNSRSTVAVKGKLGEANDEAHDFSTKVECTNGQQIIAERPMYFNYNGVWTGGHDVVGYTP